MRGEHLHATCWKSLHMGSSPHARGTREQKYSTQSKKGIIPACAGNTLWGVVWLFSDWDHPRMRGEHSLSLGGQIIVTGSSPHARGTHQGHKDFVGHTGIIPACAGNTRMTGTQTFPKWDHPRMRGEHNQKPSKSLRFQGSSPHARGTH